VSGTAQPGQTLSASPGSWSNSPSSFAYQWLRCDTSGIYCFDIGAATGQSYGVSTLDSGSDDRGQGDRVEQQRQHERTLERDRRRRRRQRRRWRRRRGAPDGEPGAGC